MEELEDILINKLNKNEHLILIYILKNNINNNKILINSSVLIYFNTDGFEVCHDMTNEPINYIITDTKINDDRYILKTHFYLGEIHTLAPYKYIDTKCIGDYILPTMVNTNNIHYAIPKEIYDNRPNFGSSKIIWAPSWDNISNDHIIIKTINKLGFEYYKRTTNLVDVVPTNNPVKIEQFSKYITNPLNICIYQENNDNLLGMINKVYFNWFFDSFRNKIAYDNDSLFLYQFPFYGIKENVLRQKYKLPVDINRTNEYPNCFQLCFNIKMLQEILLTTDINKYNMTRSVKTCYILRKTADSHPLKMMNKIEDYFIHPSNSICIESFNLQQNIKTFLHCKKFYCYDNVSFLPVIATICGCTTILCPTYPGFSDIRQLYKKYCPWMYYGMAYGDNVGELTFAQKTRPQLIEFINNIESNPNIFSENSCDKHILDFLKYLECYFNVSFAT